jgi:hypothetical protein
MRITVVWTLCARFYKTPDDLLNLRRSSNCSKWKEFFFHGQGLFCKKVAPWPPNDLH